MVLLYGSLRRRTLVRNGTILGDGYSVAIIGFVGGENDSALAGSLVFSGSSQGATDPGTYTITPGGLTSNNYDIQFVDGELTLSVPGASNPNQVNVIVGTGIGNPSPDNQSTGNGGINFVTVGAGGTGQQIKQDSEGEDSTSCQAAGLSAASSCGGAGE